MTCIWLLKTELYDTLVCKGVVKWSVLISSCYKTNLANHLLETGGTAMVRPAVFLSINSLSKQKFEAMSLCCSRQQHQLSANFERRTAGIEVCSREAFCHCVV